MRANRCCKLDTKSRLLLLRTQMMQPSRLSDTSACLPQIANSFGNGVDKLAFHQRQEHVQERLNMVLDSAERPFEGARRARHLQGHACKLHSGLSSVLDRQRQCLFGMLTAYMLTRSYVQCLVGECGRRASASCMTGLPVSAQVSWELTTVQRHAACPAAWRRLGSAWHHAQELSI